MRTALALSFFLLASAPLSAQDTLTLGNDPWPPFIIEGEAEGRAEAIVCEALRRAGWGCRVEVDDWEQQLQRAEAGELDGIAAIWFTAERATTLRFSTPYLTNRLVPVTRADAGFDIRSVGELAGRRVALEVAAAYGQELATAQSTFTVVPARGVEKALTAVQEGAADVAIVDELIARDFIDAASGPALVMGPIALAYRELHFAVSRAHPREQEIVAAFNQAYQAMLRDGTVNRILDIDWLVTDLKSDGVLDFVYRGGDLAAGATPGSDQTVYPVGQADYERLRESDFMGSNSNFLADDREYKTPEAAMKALETEQRCRYDSFSARIVCRGR